MARTHTSRSRLLLGTAGTALAVALAALPQTSRAQAINASPEIINGSVSIDSTVSGVDTITVSSSTAQIDWFPAEDGSGNALTYLPAGTTAIFQDAPGQGGFAILNRIMPSANGNIVVFDGRVVSRLQDVSGNFTPGGFVAFYSPTGILVGSTAVFDVGQLLLTTLDVPFGAFDAFVTQGGALTLTAPVGFPGDTSVEIQSGATINAPSEGSFFIAAAPQVIMSGAARINGSTAYVAGTDMTFSYANGLFDIQIGKGTSVGGAIIHDGSTGGPASTGAGDNHVIYGVAAAQANPITLLFSGNLGFDPAVSATIENGDIILAANYDVSGRAVAGGDVSDPISDYFGGFPSFLPQADISILPGNYSSRFTAVGTHDVQANASTGGITFTDDATLIARQTASMLAGNGFQLSIAGNARVDASNAGIIGFPSLPSDLDGVGGTASISADTGGLVTITGDALVQANGFAGYDSSSGTGGNGTGGVAEIAATAGAVDIGGGVSVSAIGGGFDSSSLLTSGSFTGGDAHIFAIDGGAVTITGDASVDAGASSTALVGLGAQAGGATTGGTAQIGTLGTGGSIDIGGSAALDATAFGQISGSSSLTPASVTGGQATLFTGANGTIDIGLDADLAAWAEGRDNGGSAIGGQAVIQSNGVSISIGGGADLDSSALGGDSAQAQGALGGDATGGLSSIDGSSGTIAIAGSAFLESDGAGGNGGDGGTGGTGTAGRSQVGAFGTSSIMLGSAFLQSIGTGGSAFVQSDNGGVGNGGESEIVTDGGSIVITGQVQVLADGFGGEGENGGAATSGLAGAYAITGSIDIGGDFNASATATGGSAANLAGGQGGDAQGGSAYLQADGTNTVGASLTVGGASILDASGFGGEGGFATSSIPAGAGGIGRGGTFDGTQGSGGVFALAGRDTGILDLGDVTMSANGTGGAGGFGGSGQAGGTGGDGFGGTAQAGTFSGGGDGSVNGGSASYGALTIFANGAGGAGGTGLTDGAGGGGAGGFAGIFAQGATVTAGVVEIYGRGAGGAGSIGGAGTGGDTGFGVFAGANMSLASFLADSSGFGGEGLAGNGGLGTGGDASGDNDGTLGITGGTGFTATLAANGTGGASTGGAGGAGNGGTATVQNTGQFSMTADMRIDSIGQGGASTGGAGGAALGGTSSLQNLGGNTNIGGRATLDAFADGGDGGSGAGVNGGAAIGGLATIEATQGAITIAQNVSLVASGEGGFGGNGGNGAGGVGQLLATGTGMIAVGDAFIEAAGTGGGFSSAVIGIGGAGAGGEARFETQDAGAIDAAGDVTLLADGDGGDGQTGGAAIARVAGVYAIGGSIDIGGDLFAFSSANGGSASTGFGGAGGDAVGGDAFVQADGDNTTSASIIVGGATFLLAEGVGGDGGDGDGVSIAAGRGGNGTGGTFDGTPGSGGVFALAGRDNAILDLGDVTMSAFGRGGTGGAGGAGQAGGAGGDGLGGTAQAGTFAGRGDGTIDGGSASYGALSMSSNGLGGAGGAGLIPGDGGDGTGGVAGLFAQGAPVTAGVVEIFGHGLGGTGSPGGDGTGGSNGFGVIDGASMTLASLLADASGFGGQGLTSSGGRGTGGDSTGDYDGQVDVAGDLSFIANGVGGSAGGNPGGAGNGGAAALRGVGGSATVGGTLFVNAHGVGGDAFSNDEPAGDGSGGTALASVTTGATMTLGAAQISAGGQGGSGPTATGGNGTGGMATISADGAGSDIAILGFAPASGGITPDGAFLSAFGQGGDTTTIFGTVGGAGQGGTASLLVTAGGSITLADDGPGGRVNTVIAGALGGNSSVDGGMGGSANGGFSQIAVDNGTLSVGEYVQSSFATGGSSANSDASISGGDATGGNRTILVSNGGSLTGALSGGGSGAQGGNGSGSGNGGNARGSTNRFIVDGASATLTGPNNFFASATGGSGAIGGNATSGQIDVSFTNGADVTMIANSAGAGVLGANSVSVGGGGVTRGGDAFGDAISILVTDSTVSGAFNALSQATGGDASDGRGGDATSSSARLIVDGSSVTLTGDSLFSTLAVGGSGSTGGNAFGGLAETTLDNAATLIMDQESGGGLTVSDEARGGDGTTTGGSAEGGLADFTLRGGSSASLGNLRLTTLATANGGGDATGGDAALFLANGGSFDADSVTISVFAETDTGAASGGNAVAIPGSSSTATITTLAIDSSVSATGGGSASGGFTEVSVQSSAEFDIANLMASQVGPGGGVVLSASNNSALLLGDLTATATGTMNNAVLLTAEGGTISISGNAAIDTSGIVAVRNFEGGTIGGPSAIIDIDAGGTVSFLGNNDAQIGFSAADLNITSTELDITDGARIGTEFLDLDVRGNDAMTIVGGDTEEAGYTLTQQEIDRIEVVDADFNTSSDGSASDDLLIRDLTISGSADDGTSSVEIVAGGVVRVEGILAYIDATADDSLEIFADRLEIVTPGGIGIVDPDGNPIGTFEFFGSDFWMADADTLAQLLEDRSFAGRDELLAGVAQGSDDPLGYLRAGDIEFYIVGGGSVLVRNTGTTEAPGGITVTGSLEFESGVSQEPLDVFAYGRLLNPDGSFVTGADFFRLVNFNRVAPPDGQAVTYSDSSMFNDCVINTPECGEVEPPTQFPPEVEKILPKLTTPAVQIGPIGLVPLEVGKADADAEFGVDFPGLIETASLGEDGTIDDPVTSGGDAALFGLTEKTAGGEADDCETDGASEEEENCDVE